MAEKMHRTLWIFYLIQWWFFICSHTVSAAKKQLNTQLNKQRQFQICMGFSIKMIILVHRFIILKLFVLLFEILFQDSFLHYMFLIFEMGFFIRSEIKDITFLLTFALKIAPITS